MPGPKTSAFSSPRHRPAFLDSDPWRSLRILAEFVEGFDALAGVGKAVTIFGSARIDEGDPYYAKARELAANLASEGFAVITGGGPGIMEAANRGCHEAGGLSIGCNIELPHEQSVNPYVDLGVEFRYFFARKTMFVKYADGFAIFPGGFGTLDELFESLTLIQTGKIRHFPVVLIGTEYWGGPARLAAQGARCADATISPGRSGPARLHGRHGRSLPDADRRLDPTRRRSGAAPTRSARTAGQPAGFKREGRSQGGGVSSRHRQAAGHEIAVRKPAAQPARRAQTRRAGSVPARGYSGRIGSWASRRPPRMRAG